MDKKEYRRKLFKKVACHAGPAEHNWRRTRAAEALVAVRSLITL